MKRIFKISKWLHRYIGLFLILFLMWESLSGVLMNHPEIIADISVPKWLVPSQYHIVNWNRSSLTKLIYSERNENQAFACGKQGVWITENNGDSFHSYMEGYPESPYYFKTSDLYLHETESRRLLFAASNGGLFKRDIDNGNWEQVRLEEDDEPVKRILKVNNNLIVFSESNVYQASITNPITKFKKVTPQRTEVKSEVSLIDLFFHLHDGRIWGLPGKLLFDVVGLIIFFLSLSAFYTWYFPKMLKRKRRERTHLNSFVKRIYRLFFKYHLKLGIWASIITIIIAGTGFFMRPPLLAVIANGSIDAKYYPGFLSQNPWNEKIQNALFEPGNDQIIIATSEGFYSGPSDFQSEFKKIELNVPVFVMGANVFELDADSNYLVGSFSGLFRINKIQNKTVDMIKGKEVNGFSNIRPAKKMITGYIVKSGQEFVTTHRQGLIPIDTSNTEIPFKMPRELTANFRMPLWNYLFEIHNGRFFRGVLGGFNILIVPVGALLFLIITISGVYDWFYIRRRKDKSKNEN